MTAPLTILPQQITSWRFYGPPEDPSTVSPFAHTTHQPRPVGEASYVVDWIADQLSRMEWRVLVDNSETWTVRTPKGTVTSTATQSDPEAPDHPIRASQTLLALINWSSETVRQIAVNLFVAGECHYVATADDAWTVVSVIRPDRQRLIDSAVHSIRALWPHAADPCQPHAPLFNAEAVLSQLDWLTRLSEAQSSTRIGMRGVVGIADTMATQSGKDFWDELNDATQANMASPDNLAPVTIRGPQDLIEPTGNGMKGFSWVVPEFPYDDKIDERIQSAIQRLAYSLPIPPAVLLGAQAASRATMFQIDEAGYRQHIEPPADKIARVAVEALTLLLDRPISLNPDPTNLLARKHSVQDVLDAFDRGAVSLSYVRSVLGIPEHAAAREEDLEILYTLRGRSDAEPTPDQATQAEEDPFPSQQNAAVSPTYIAGLTQQATDRARERVGAKARTYPALRRLLAPEVPNQQVAAALGTQVLIETGVPVEESIRLGIAPAVAAFPELADRLFIHVLETLETDESQPLPPEDPR